MLEIVSGKRNRGFSVDNHHHNLAGHVSAHNAGVEASERLML